MARNTTTFFLWVQAQNIVPCAAGHTITCSGRSRNTATPGCVRDLLPRANPNPSMFHARISWALERRHVRPSFEWDRLYSRSSGSGARVPSTFVLVRSI